MPPGPRSVGKPRLGRRRELPHRGRELSLHDVGERRRLEDAAQAGADRDPDLAERLRVGQRQYGFLNLASDPRSFRSKEAREELEDALVYLACAWLRDSTQEVA